MLSEQSDTLVMPNSSAPPVIIVGAGLAGLACAIRLHEAGQEVKVYEASDGVGGRVRTDRVDGFLLDRGFQVYLDAYPTAGGLLDLKRLDLHAFEPGALVYDGRELHRVMDVFRRPSSLISSALAPIGSLLDKFRVALLRFRATGSDVSEIQSRPDTRTESFLRDFGFSDRMIDGFFRAFYGGIFLERDLRTSSRMFEFTYKMFSEGSATLPAYGMGAITDQLAKRLPEGCIELHSAVGAISPDHIVLANGSHIPASKVIVATQAPQTARLVPTFAPQKPGWRSVTNVYFAADETPIDSPIIALNATGKGLVNNVCVPNQVCPNYAPDGQNLVSVSVLGQHRDTTLANQVIKELTTWFGEEVETWRHLRTDVIQHALPEQLPAKSFDPSAGYLHLDDILICGDHTTSASIEGAIISGQATADAYLALLPKP